MRLTTLLILSTQFMGCASFSMARNKCEAPPELPTKPIVSALLARPGSTGIYANQIVDIENWVCLSPEDSKARERWIKDVLRACGN